MNATSLEYLSIIDYPNSHLHSIMLNGPICNERTYRNYRNLFIVRFSNLVLIYCKNKYIHNLTRIFTHIFHIYVKLKIRKIYIN